MNNLAVVFCFIFFMLPFPLRAGEVNLNLDEAVAIALRDNRDVLLKAEDVNKAKKKIAESYGALWPSLDFMGGWTDTKGLTRKDLAVSTTQTTVRQILYQGGSLINTIKYNQSGMEVAQALLDQAKLETVLTVKKAFYTFILTKNFVVLNKAILDNTQEHLNFLKARYESGQASASEILKIEESLSSVSQAYDISLNQLTAAEALIRNLLYLDDEVKIRSDSSLEYESAEIAYDEAFLKAMRTRPEIRQYEAQSIQAKKAVEIAKAGNRPTIFASWEYFSRNSAAIASAGTITGATASGSSRAWNDYNTLGFTFSWPVFDGWATKAKVEQAIIDLKEAQLLKEKAVKDISLELKNSYLGLKNAISGLKTAESNIKFYKDNLAVFQQKKDQGIASFLDFNDADLQYNVSMFNKKQAVYDYIIAKANFDKATGGF